MGAILSFPGARAQNPLDLGPDSVDSLLEDSRRRHENHLNKDLLENWDANKEEVAEKTGISRGSEYSFQTFGASSVPDFVDTFPLASPWTAFTNLAFSTGASSMALPNDATFGAMLGSWLSDEVYLIAGITDLNSNPRDPFDGINTFFNTNEYYTSLELGWTPSKGEFYSDNIHVTFWHVDAVTATGTPDGWGANFSIVHWVDDTWMPFFRGGWAEDGGSLLNTSLYAGVVLPAGKDSEDIFGAGVHWGTPVSTTFGPGPGDQTSIELFYRAQLTQSFRLTPSIQLLFGPALNPTRDMIPVFGMRGVMTF